MKSESQNVEEVKCAGCGKVVDPDVCGCGEPIAPGVTHDNHYPIPAGCDCFRDRSNFLMRDEP